MLPLWWSLPQREVPLSLQSWRRDTIVTVLPFRDVLRTNLPCCNRLIRDNKAALIQSAEEFVQIMGWAVAEQPARTEGIQRNLFPELTEEEELVVRILMRQGDLHINAMVVEADIPVNRMSALLFELEMKGVVKAMVGGVYHLLT